MQTLTVDLGTRSYPIYIGNGLLDRAELLTAHIPGRQVLTVSNETVAPLYLTKLNTLLAGYRHETVILPDGEEHKTLATTQRIFDALMASRFERSATVIALGGGVGGDIGGFAAACYQRGVHFIQVPTTLLAQVDSSVGGKTGVNHPLGKNMIGAFHQPRCVLADTDTLATLPERELAAGLAEIIKYGLIRDAEFLGWLEEHMDALNARDPIALTEAIARSCRHKAAVVAADEHEAGQRALLNLGHTFGHAIENLLGYGEWLHGEAVSAGLAMAARMSRRLGWIGETECVRLEQLLLRARLPIAPPAGLTPAALREVMAVDKKVQAGQVRLVLLRGIGDAVVTGDFPLQALDDLLDDYCGNAAAARRT